MSMLGRWDRWHFYRDHRDEWRWSRYAARLLVGKSTEGYHNRMDCEANAARLGWNRQCWSSAGAHDRWKFYRDARGEFRWRRTALNNRIVGAAHKGFATLGACEANARRHGWQPPTPKPASSTSDWRRCV